MMVYHDYIHSDVIFSCWVVSCLGASSLLHHQCLRWGLAPSTASVNMGINSFLYNNFTFAFEHCFLVLSKWLSW